MYTVNKGPSKLVAKTRGGLSQNYEKIETIREISRKCSENYENTEMNVPRPVFQQQRKTYHNHHHYNHGLKEQSVEEQQISTPQHEELVKYIRDSWNMVASTNPYDSTVTDETTSAVPQKKPTYHEDPPSPLLKDFGAFDLESWWGRRLFNNITKSL